MDKTVYVVQDSISHFHGRSGGAPRGILSDFVAAKTLAVKHGCYIVEWLIDGKAVGEYHRVEDDWEFEAYE